MLHYRGRLHLATSCVFDREKTWCKCPPKRIRDGFESDRSNHFRRWSGLHSRRNWI